MYLIKNRFSLVPQSNPPLNAAVAHEVLFFINISLIITFVFSNHLEPKYLIDFGAFRMRILP